MKIPIPCRFGERAECNGSRLLLFTGLERKLLMSGQG